MNIATIKVSGVKAVTNDYPTIPAGIVGATVTFEFTDPAWDGLSKTAVFRGCVTRDVLMTGNIVRIPAETVAQACPFLFVGVYGTDAADNLVIPTLWLSLGTVRDAADPSGDPGTDPDLPIWAQLQDRVEALESGTPSDPDSPGTPGRPGKDGEDGGYYTPAVTQPSSDIVEFAFSPSKPDMPAVDPVQVRLPVGQGSGGNVELDTTLTQSGKAADAKAVGDKIAEITGVSLVEPAEDDIPKVFITGVKPTTKDDVLAEMEYISKTKRFHAYLEIKCQGSSSMNYAKKNFTVKLYSDEARETKQKKVFKDWNHESNKFVLKANWIDHSHARNIVSARLWDEVVKSRANYNALPEEMRNSPQSGAIDGFPVKLYYNGTYEGLYTWNIGKDAWMWGMDEDNPNHSLLSCGYNDNGVLLNKAGNFRALWSGVHEDNWDIEVGTQGTALTNSLNALISCVKDTDDETFKATIGTYLDINSALDYYLYFWANAGLDSLENNMLLATYDGVKWICGAYDMDSVWGLHYTGSKFIAVDFKCPDQYQGAYSLLWERITKLFVPELQARYAELRSGVLSYPNIVTHFERFMDVIGSELYAEDLTIYTGIPSGSTNNIKQIRNYVRDRLAYVDGEVPNMSDEPTEPDIPDEPDNPEPTDVPCTGISLNANTLTFDGEGTQTLTATVTPDGCTDVVTWESNDTNVATVSGGVVTAVANGSATITAKCGEYSANCTVNVSGIGSGVVGEWADDVFFAPMVSGKAIGNGGAIVDYNGVWTNENPVEVSSEYVYTFTPSAGYTAIDIYGYDENGNAEEYIIRGGKGKTSYTFSVGYKVKNINFTIYNKNTESIVELTRIAEDATLVSVMGTATIDSATGKYTLTTSVPLTTQPVHTPVEYGKFYIVDFGGTANSHIVYEYDENLNYIGVDGESVVSGTAVIFTPSETARYVRIVASGEGTGRITFATYIMPDKNESVVEESNNLVPMYSGYNYSNGAIVSGTAHVTFNYYPVTPGESYTISFGQGATYTGVHEYDESLSYIAENRNVNRDKGNLTFTATENAKYVRWACLGNPSKVTVIVKN